MFFYLIMNHFILSTKEGLESNCTTPSDAGNGKSDGGCKRVATQQNSQAAQFTKRKMAIAKKTITDLMNKVSKLIQTEKIPTNQNTKGIETNLTNVGKMKQAITPDK